MWLPPSTVFCTIGSFGSEWYMCYSFGNTSCAGVAHFQLCVGVLTHLVEWLCLVLRGFLCFCPCDGGALLPRLWNAPGLCFRFAANLNKQQLKRAERDVTSPLKRSDMVFGFNVSSSQGCKCPRTSIMTGEDTNATSGQRTEVAPVLHLNLKLVISSNVANLQVGLCKLLNLWWYYIYWVNKKVAVACTSCWWCTWRSKYRVK